jgi:hypothetical protein
MAGRGRDPVFKKPRAKTNEARREKAIARLKVIWQLDNDDGEWEPETEPIITPMLKTVDGGVEHCITTLRAHDDDDARAFIAMWDDCTMMDRKMLTIEEIAHAAGIGSLRLVEVIQTALFLYGNMQTQMMMAAGLPKIVAMSIKQARKPRGLADREWMLKAGKILPIPKGSQIAIQNNLVEGRETQQITEGSHEWKYPEDRLKEIVAITNPKQLAASNSEHGDVFHLDRKKTTVFER